MNIEDYLKTQLKQAVQSIGLQEENSLTIDLSPGKQKEHGDFATNLPFLLAPVMRRSPRQIGQSIVDHIDLDKSSLLEPGHFRLQSCHMMGMAQKSGLA